MPPLCTECWATIALVVLNAQARGRRWRPQKCPRVRIHLGRTHLADNAHNEYHAHRELQSMRRNVRHALQLGVLLLVVRLFVDLATPLLPGAYHLDPNESVVVAGASYQAGLNATVQPPLAARQSPSPSQPQSETVVAPTLTEGARRLRTPVPRLTYAPERTASTPSSDDD